MESELLRFMAFRNFEVMYLVVLHDLQTGVATGLAIWLKNGMVKHCLT